MSVAEIGRCSILGGMKHMQRGARMGMYVMDPPAYTCLQMIDTGALPS